MAKDPEPRAQREDQKNTLTNRRAKLYTAGELQIVQTDFSTNFKVLDGGIEVPFTATEVSLELDSINEVELSLFRNYGIPVRGIHFYHGLNGRDYLPVIQFMYADPVAKGDLQLFSEEYSVRNKKVVSILPSEADALRREYLRNTRLMDATSNQFRKLQDSGTYPDMSGEWFPYADNVNKLIADNRNSKYLVVSCISELLSYSSLALADASTNYRHMLALYTADDVQANLGTLQVPSTASYAGLAMDLGFLCPPRCK
jgi:hypothetical protein